VGARHPIVVVGPSAALLVPDAALVQPQPSTTAVMCATRPVVPNISIPQKESMTSTRTWGARHFAKSTYLVR
jgi:hypothetical protein